MKEKNEPFEVFVTKYALTTGITCNLVTMYGPNMVCEEGRKSLMSYHGKDWHTTFEDAVARANEMREKKIKSLKKQIAKLEGLVFDGPIE